MRVISLDNYPNLNTVTFNNVTQEFQKIVMSGDIPYSYASTFVVGRMYNVHWQNGIDF